MAFPVYGLGSWHGGSGEAGGVIVNRVNIDWKAVEREVATSSDMRAAVHDAAEKVAEHARNQGVDVVGVPGEIPIPVKVYDDTTDGMRVNRAVSRVVLAHAAGMATQAKHGTLSKAASAAGLRLKGD